MINQTTLQTNFTNMIDKTPSPANSKMWSTLIVHLKLPEIST